MKLCIAIVALAFGACTGTSTQTDRAAGEAATRDLIQQTAALNNQADSLGWVSLFDDEAVYMAPDMPAVTTKAGLRSVASAGFGGYRADVSIEPAEIVMLDDWAFARSVVTGTVTSRADGEVIPVDVKQLVLYRWQEDGRWKIARLMINSNS